MDDNTATVITGLMIAAFYGWIAWLVFRGGGDDE